MTPFVSTSPPHSFASSVPAKSASLQPATRYYWRVTVGDNKGNMATSSETACF